MGSVSELFTLFTSAIQKIIGAGSTAVDTGSDVADGVFAEAIGSVSGIVNN